MLRRVPAGKPDERFVPGHDDTLGIEHENRVLQRLQRRLKQMRARRQLALGIFQPTGAAHDDVHAGDEADKGATENQQTGDVGLLLLGAQRGQPTRELQLLAFDERLGDLPDVIGGGAPRALIERRVAAVAAGRPRSSHSAHRASRPRRPGIRQSAGRRRDRRRQRRRAGARGCRCAASPARTAPDWRCCRSAGRPAGRVPNPAGL